MGSVGKKNIKYGNRLKITSAMVTKTVRMDVKKQPMFLSSGKELLRIGWWGRSVSLSVFIMVHRSKNFKNSKISYFDQF